MGDLKYLPRGSYQSDITKFIIDNKRCNVFADMGVGKGPATLDAICHLFLFGEVKRVLVLGPKRVALSTWPGEISKFETFQHLTYAVAVGTASERIAALEKNSEITICTYDLLPWLIETLGDNWPFDMVVADEVTRLKSLRVSLQRSKTGKQFITGQGGKRAKALVKVAISKVTRWVGLTGTPAPNGIQDLWALLFFIDCGFRLGTSFSAYTDRYFRNIQVGSGYSKIEPLPFAQGHVEEKIKDVCVTIKAKDYFDLPPLVENIIRVELPPSARKIYLEMEKALFTEIEGNEIEAFNAATKTNKCLQIASGAAYIDDKGAWVQVHDAKINALESIVEEACGMPILVGYQFKSDLARILKAFPKAKHLDSNPKTIDDFNAGKIQMLVAHPKSAGHGISLQHGTNIMVFFSTGWNLEDDLQFQERAGPTRQAQSGYKRTVYVHRLVGKSTLEEDVVARLRTKASVQDTLMQAMKKR